MREEPLFQLPLGERLGQRQESSCRIAQDLPQPQSEAGGVAGFAWKVVSASLPLMKLSEIMATSTFWLQPCSSGRPKVPLPPWAGP